MSETVEIGVQLPRVVLYLSPGHDHHWTVSVTDSAGAALGGTVTLKIGSVTLIGTLVAGSANFTLDKTAALASLVQTPVAIDWTDGFGTLTAVARGTAVRA
jgi:hypothetical protein